MTRSTTISYFRIDVQALRKLSTDAEYNNTSNFHINIILKSIDFFPSVFLILENLRCIQAPCYCPYILTLMTTILYFHIDATLQKIFTADAE